MSIRDEINSHVYRLTPKLHILTPLLPSERAGSRVMVVSSDIYSAVQPESWPNNRTGARLARMRGALDRFSGNDRISLAMDPKNKPATTYLARIRPVTNAVWDIRSTEITPGIRVLGRFAEMDTFVALVWAYHEAVKGDKAWADFGQRCIDEWRILFHSSNPLTGSVARDYVSTNCVQV
jgi:hypothetical protein